MANLDACREAFKAETLVSPRLAKSMRTRAQAFSPLGIFVRLLAAPIAAAVVAGSLLAIVDLPKAMSLGTQLFSDVSCETSPLTSTICAQAAHIGEALSLVMHP